MPKQPLTSPPSHADLVVLAVYLLGRGRAPVDTEDVAVKAYELAPTRFSWRKFKQHINLELVRVSLSDAKKAEKGALLDGSGNTGWSLTPAGLQWARRAAEELDGHSFERPREDGRGGSISEQRWRRERDRLLATSAWAQWSRGAEAPPVSVREAEEVFRIDSYADARMRSMKVTRLQEMFESDSQVAPFLVRMGELLDNAEPNSAKSGKH